MSIQTWIKAPNYKESSSDYIPSYYNNLQDDRVLSDSLFMKEIKKINHLINIPFDSKEFSMSSTSICFNYPFPSETTLGNPYVHDRDSNQTIVGKTIHNIDNYYLSDSKLYELFYSGDNIPIITDLATATTILWRNGYCSTSSTMKKHLIDMRSQLSCFINIHIPPIVNIILGYMPVGEYDRLWSIIINDHERIWPLIRTYQKAKQAKDQYIRTEREKLQPNYPQFTWNFDYDYDDDY